MLRIILRLAIVVLIASLPFPVCASAPDDGERAAWRAMSWRQSHDVRQGPETSEKIVNRFKVGASGSIDISNVSGRIVVSAGGTDTIVVEATKRVRSRGGDAKGQLERAVVTMTGHGGRVEVRTSYSGRESRASVDYAVTAPAGTSVYAHSVSGDIRVTAVKGEVQVESVSGDVDVESAPGATHVKTVSGDASVSGVSNRDELSVSTVSGTVTVSGARVRSLDAESVSGDVRLRGIEAERVTASSVSGGLEFDGALARSGRYEFRSQSGDVRLALAGTTGFEIDAGTFSGNIRCDLPVTARVNGAGGGRSSRHTLRGLSGDGSAQLSLRSFSGDITVARK